MWSGGRGPVLVAVAAGWFLSLGVRLVYPAVLPYLRADFGFGHATAGLLLSTLWVAYALGQLPGGILDDYVGERAVLVTSTLGSAVVLAVVVASDAVAPLFAATAFFGLTTALYGVARFTVLSDVYPDHDGTAIGLTMAAGDLGNALLPPAAGFLAATVAWQLGLGVAVPLFVVAAVGIFLVVPRDPAAMGGEPAPGDCRDDAAGAAEPAPDSSPSVAATVRELVGALRSRPVLVVTLVQLLGYCVWQAFTGFYPTYLIEVKGVAPTTATAVFGGFFALGIVVKPVAGTLYDGYGVRRTLPVVLAVVAVGMASVTVAERLLTILVATALASAVLGYATITLTFLTDSLPSSVQGTGLGVLRTGYMLVGAAAPTAMGAFAEAGLFDEGFLLLALVAGVAVFLPLLLPAEADAVAVGEADEPPSG